MGTTVEPSQIGTIGSILKSKGDKTLDKLSQELKVTQTVTPTVKGATPAQIAAAQDAVANNGKALVNMQGEVLQKPKITVSPLLPDEGALQKTINSDTEKLANLRKQLGKARQKGQRQKIRSQIGQLETAIRKNQEKLSNASRVRQQIAKQIQVNSADTYSQAASPTAKAIMQGAAAGAAKGATQAAVNKAVEKKHFDKVFKNIETESANAKVTLANRTERFKALQKLGLSKKEAYEASKTEAAFNECIKAKKFAKESAAVVEKVKKVSAAKPAAQAAKGAATAAKGAVNGAEKAHFDKVFKEIEGRNTAAQKALKERAAAYKAKNGISRRITKFFKIGPGRKVVSAIKKHPRIAAAFATLAVLTGIYAFSGDKAPKEVQPQDENV